MRNISRVLFCSVMLATAHGSAALLASVPSTTNPQTAETEKAQETVSLKISGMTWPVNCPIRVRSALEKVPGVISAEVTHPDKAVVKIEKGKATPKQLVAAVEKAGYKAELK